MLDLMADLSSCPEGAKGEQATSVADQIMDGVSQTLMYPSAPTVAALLEVRKALISNIYPWEFDVERTFSSGV